MEKNKFIEVAVSDNNKKWTQCLSRQRELYQRQHDIRSEFARDYNRILHCTAYRRLKHKTQVFFATRNDHICTRIEHVTHVASVSYTIANFLGLNTELTNAIAIGHDLGHAPFGHQGESILKEIVEKKIGKTFWHEKNSLRFVDKIESLPDENGKEQNLNLTYAVRDGIVSHCGEVDENAIYPRDEFIDLYQIQSAGVNQPFTWEGCVVKIADKISYIGRDIEDALTLGILSMGEKRELKRIVAEITGISDLRDINNTVLMHGFITDLCTASSPEKGLGFSDTYLPYINSVKKFNYKHIYKHKRLDYFKDYARLIIGSIFDVLANTYDSKEPMKKIQNIEKIYPSLARNFYEWIKKYSDVYGENRSENGFQNEIIYRLEDEKDYLHAIIDYISSMTDSFAIKAFNEITSF